MNVTLTSEDLIKFEEECVELFGQKKIRAPIHLDNGNEHQLIQVFSKHVSPEDWVMGSWRMHYKCLLKGVPPEELKNAILEGRSIGLCFQEHKIISSAIVGGILPIALGTALGIKQSGGKNKVVCFVGDMTSQSGIFHECRTYAVNHGLPVLWVIEDNGKSVCTDTKQVWGTDRLLWEPQHYKEGVYEVAEDVLYFKYESKYPHAGGGGKRIQF
jgi:TPP-dependent pyruvate/acetoin dehydrogenase alpha subunit